MPVTPVRQQYLRIKNQYPQAILLFRLGDFYESFDEDARITSRELDIVLTSREMGKGQPVPMAGIPYHALDGYLSKLIARGYKVAICEQLSPPGKGLVEREVIRVVTPGTLVEPDLLESKTNNYLAAFYAQGNEAGIAYVDISTGEFRTTQLAREAARLELGRIQPAELLLAQGQDNPGVKSADTVLEGYWFEPDTAKTVLMDQFKVNTLEAYGCASLPLATAAAGAVVHYLQQTQKGLIGQLEGLATYSSTECMQLDPQTRQNLDLFQSSRDGKRDGSLLSVIDFTRTPMGGRMLRAWLGQPLLDMMAIRQRHTCVKWCHDQLLERRSIMEKLGGIADLERVLRRISSGQAYPHEVRKLGDSLEIIPGLIEILTGTECGVDLLKGLNPCPEVSSLIRDSIADQPGEIGEGRVIREGWSIEIDKLRNATLDARRFLAEMERKERDRTGIKSLKIGYNRVFGYYLEVSSANLNLVPDDYIRKQTLTNGERFYTPQLKEFETVAESAREKLAELEGELFRIVCRQVTDSSGLISETARAVARIDVLCGLAEAASRYGYVCPTMTEDNRLEIHKGRHPVIERHLPPGGFVPNDLGLDTSKAQIIVLTGPNMSGKSTYLRQNALIVLMAQIGSFIPAESAIIGIVDRVFTRIGAQEDLTAGQSTFMVEMTETANILNNATRRSLIILDEIGRGTSTYDGLAIAWAVIEYLHNHPRLGAKTIFATHYHELVDLESILPRLRNFNVAVHEDKGEVVFLRQIVAGGADRSYGIHVGKLAGLPRSVVRRADEILGGLESAKIQASKTPIVESRALVQPRLFGGDDALKRELKALEVDGLTPLEAISKLYELKKMAQDAA
jgi:DNA mismatch repair protein MutS